MLLGEVLAAVLLKPSEYVLREVRHGGDCSTLEITVCNRVLHTVYEGLLERQEVFQLIRSFFRNTKFVQFLV